MFGSLLALLFNRVATLVELFVDLSFCYAFTAISLCRLDRADTLEAVAGIVFLVGSTCTTEFKVGIEFMVGILTSSILLFEVSFDGAIWFLSFISAFSHPITCSS